MERNALQTRYQELKVEGERLAGSLSNLAQRATVYRHLFLASRGNHTFPLIAAHGALWAGGYFRWGMKLGEMLSWQYLGRPALRQQQLLRLAEFADAFRDINRRVCIDTYVNYYFTEQYGDHPEVQNFVPTELLTALNRLHAARRAGRDLTAGEKQEMFSSHFLHEQQHVVGPTLTEAVAQFAWPLVREIALRPIVHFSYFPLGKHLWFKNFASREERIEKGHAAYQIAAQVGWSKVDAALQEYQLLPTAFFDAPTRYFASWRESILAAPC